MRQPVLRYAFMAVAGFVALFAVLLLVRPLIFSVAPPRDDTVYVVAAVGDLDRGPLKRAILLNAPHGLLGERTSGGHAEIGVIVSRTVTGAYAVANAWSPVDDCAVSLGADRVTDCRGHQWTLAGDPFASTDPPLQRFPVRVENGALVVDFTRPVDTAG